MAVDQPGMQSVKSMVAAVPFTVLDSEPGVFGIYGWGDVVVIAWCQQATGPTAQRLKVVAEKLLSSHDRQTSYVHMVAETPLPTAEARSILSDLIVRHSSRYACVSVVLGAAGFWAGALRSVVLGMRMLAPRSFLVDFHFDLDASARWVCAHHLQRTGVGLDVAQLHAALQQIADQVGLHFRSRSLPPTHARG